MVLNEIKVLLKDVNFEFVSENFHSIRLQLECSSYYGGHLHKKKWTIDLLNSNYHIIINNRGKWLPFTDDILNQFFVYKIKNENFIERLFEQYGVDCYNLLNVRDDSCFGIEHYNYVKKQIEKSFL